MCSKERKKARREKLISKKGNHFIPDHAVKPISPCGLVQVAILGYCLLHSSVKIWKSDLMCLWLHTSAPSTFSQKKTLFIFDICHLQMHFSSCIICKESTCVIMDKVFHSLSVFFYCCYVSVSVKRTTLERDHCPGLRCQWRRGHS